jgi:hypothetical protein
MKKYRVPSFVCGAVVMLAFTTLGQSNPSHHIPVKVWKVET